MRTQTTSVGFSVAVHVAVAGLGHLCAVETVQETSGDLRHHGSVWDGLGHAVDRSLKQQKDRQEKCKHFALTACTSVDIVLDLSLNNTVPSSCSWRVIVLAQGF